MIAFDDNGTPILCSTNGELLTLALITENVRAYNAQRDAKMREHVAKVAKCKVCRGKPGPYGCDGCRYHG